MQSNIIVAGLFIMYTSIHDTSQLRTNCISSKVGSHYFHCLAGWPLPKEHYDPSGLHYVSLLHSPHSTAVQARRRRYQFTKKREPRHCWLSTSPWRFSNYYGCTYLYSTYPLLSCAASYLRRKPGTNYLDLGGGNYKLGCTVQNSNTTLRSHEARNLLHINPPIPHSLYQESVVADRKIESQTRISGATIPSTTHHNRPGDGGASRRIQKIRFDK